MRRIWWSQWNVNAHRGHNGDGSAKLGTSISLYRSSFTSRWLLKIYKHCGVALQVSAVDQERRTAENLDASSIMDRKYLWPCMEGSTTLMLVSTWRGRTSVTFATDSLHCLQNYPFVQYCTLYYWVPIPLEDHFWLDEEFSRMKSIAPSTYDMPVTTPFLVESPQS